MVNVTVTLSSFYPHFPTYMYIQPQMLRTSNLTLLQKLRTSNLIYLPNFEDLKSHPSSKFDDGRTVWRWWKQGVKREKSNRAWRLLLFSTYIHPQIWRMEVGGEKGWNEKIRIVTTHTQSAWTACIWNSPEELVVRCHWRPVVRYRSSRFTHTVYSTCTSA